MITRLKQTPPRSEDSTKNPVDDTVKTNKPSGGELGDDILDRVTGGEPPDPCRK